VVITSSSSSTPWRVNRLSHKDLTLLSTHPHLVLDGAEYLASIVGAQNIAVCVARDNPTVVNHVERALHERTRRSLRGPKLEMHTPPWRYVAGEESALVHWLDDNESLPQFRPTRPHVLRIGHAPVIVDNAETCANIGLIGRYGAAWFRGVGTANSPGSALVSVTGAVERPTVLEVALGTPLRVILKSASADPDPQALLLGGYGGSWLEGSHLDWAIATRRWPLRACRRAPESSWCCREARAASSRRFAWCAGWPTRARDSADLAHSVCPPSPKT